MAGQEYECDCGEMARTRARLVLIFGSVFAASTLGFVGVSLYAYIAGLPLDGIEKLCWPLLYLPAAILASAFGISLAKFVKK